MGDEAVTWDEAGWLRRAVALAEPGNVVSSPAVMSVQVLNNRNYGGSRERAPWGRSSNLVPAPGAGLHAFVEILGTGDPKGTPIKIVHRLRASAASGDIRFGLAEPSSITFNGRLVAEPPMRDDDREITVQSGVGSIATLNLPGTTGTLIRSATTNYVAELPPNEGLGWAITWSDTRSLYMWTSSANLNLYADLSWQLVRA